MAPRVPNQVIPFTTAPMGPATPYQRIEIPDAAFGAATGRALRNFGGQLVDTGNTLGDMLVRAKSIENENAANDLTTKYRETLIGKYKDFATLQGRAAVEAYPAFVESINALQDEMLGTLENDDARRRALDSMNSSRLSLITASTNHYAEQERVWSVASASAAADMAVVNANFYRNDFAKVHTELATGANEVVRVSQMNGDPPNLTQLKVMQYYGASYTAIIDNLASTDPMRAQAMFESVKDGLDPISQAKIQEQLKPKVLNAKADAAVAAVTITQVGGKNGGSVDGTSAYQYFVTRGWSNVQAAAIIGNLQQESGLDPTVCGDGGTSCGIAQWRGERLDALKEFAKASGMGWQTMEAQLSFLDYELRNGERAAGSALAGATTLEAANDAMISYERPAGWSASDPRSGHAWDKRLDYGKAYLGPEIDESGQPLPFDKDEMRSRIMKLTAGDLELQAAALTKLERQFTLQDAALGQDRAKLELHIDDLNKGLIAGQTGLSIPVTEIERLFPPEDAARIIGSLKTSEFVGQLSKSVQYATPDEINKMVADLSSGSGMYSAMIREFFKIEGGDAGAALEATVTAQIEAKLADALSARSKALLDNPAQYVLGDPNNFIEGNATVTAAHNALKFMPGPQTWGAYAFATEAEQKRLGVPIGSRKLLTDMHRSSLLTAINNMAPKGVADTLVSLQHQTGEYWPQVLGELQTGDDAIAAEYVAMGLMIDPVARGMLADVLSVERDKPGIARKSLASDVAKGIDERIEEEMAPFVRTFGDTQQGIATSAALLEASKLLAYRFSQVMGTDAAVARATNSILGAFDVSIDDTSNIARSPKGMGAAMELGGNTTKFLLSADQLMPLNDYSGLYTPEQVAEITLDNARRGVWVTSPDDVGWVLTGADGDVVQYADGSPVILTWEQAGDARFMKLGQTLKMRNFKTPDVPGIIERYKQETQQ